MLITISGYSLFIENSHAPSNMHFAGEFVPETEQTQKSAKIRVAIEINKRVIFIFIFILGPGFGQDHKKKKKKVEHGATAKPQQKAK